MHGYSHVYLCRQGRHGSGVSLFVSNSMSFIVRKDLNTLTDQVEQLFIEIDKSVLHVNKNVIFGIVSSSWQVSCYIYWNGTNRQWP